MRSFQWFCGKFPKDETSFKLIPPPRKVNATLQSAHLLVGKDLSISIFIWNYLCIVSRKQSTGSFSSWDAERRLLFALPALHLMYFGCKQRGHLCIFISSLWIVSFMTCYQPLPCLMLFSLCFSLPDTETVIPLAFLFFVFFLPFIYVVSLLIPLFSTFLYYILLGMFLMPRL